MTPIQYLWLGHFVMAFITTVLWCRVNDGVSGSWCIWTIGIVGLCMAFVWPVGLILVLLYICVPKSMKV